MGPFGSAFNIALANSLSRSPFQIFGILYFCASIGLGTNFIAASNNASLMGACAANSSSLDLSEAVYASITFFILIPFFCAIGKLNPHLSFADPNITFPACGLIIHFSLNSGSPYISIKLLTCLIISNNLFNISWGLNFSSFTNLSTLFINRIGLTLSSKLCLNTVSVCVIIPSTASTTTIEPSKTLRLLVTLPLKSTCPGVSIRLMT
uniref:Uncharacterized protein ORF-c10_003 n=1 Tax=Saccharolobus solfataricus TaxID=2287 RepID=Q9UXB6_SACSO|nr:hypothetical protein [Saccharolobus solfataricus P2]